MQNKKGFTLIELMIVVAIIAILAMIAVPMYQRYIERARNNAAQATLQQLATSQIARSTTGDDFIYAATGADLTSLLPSGFRPDPNVGILINTYNDSFVMAAAHRAIGSTVFLYDNVSGSGVVEYLTAAATAQARIVSPLLLFEMDAAGTGVDPSTTLSGGAGAAAGEVTFVPASGRVE